MADDDVVGQVVVQLLVDRTQADGELDLVCLSGRGDKDLATVLGEA